MAGWNGLLLQIQTRLLHDFKLIELRRYEHASQLIQAVARQLNGWIAQQRRLSQRSV